MILRRGPRPDSPWYRDGAFVNLDADPRPGQRRLLSFMRLLTARASAPPASGAGIPASAGTPHSAAPRGEPLGPRPVPAFTGAPFIRPLAPGELSPPPGRVRVAWLGHSSVAIVTAGRRIVIDPIFGHPPLVRRLADPPIGVEVMPPPDLLLLSHNHFDHLDVHSLRAILRRAPGLSALVPSGLDRFVRRLGVPSVRAMEWWEATQVGDVTVTFVPARHWSKRGVGDTRQSHWAGFVLESLGRRIFFAGDTAMGRHFEEIAARFPSFDAALMPIGAYSPRWIMKSRHMNPEEAVAASRTLRAAVMLPIHWGTFRLSLEPIGEPPVLARRAAEATGQPLHLWRPGDVVDL